VVAAEPPENNRVLTSNADINILFLRM